MYLLHYKYKFKNKNVYITLHNKWPPYAASFIFPLLLAAVNNDETHAKYYYSYFITSDFILIYCSPKS